MILKMLTRLEWKKSVRYSTKRNYRKEPIRVEEHSN